MSSSYDFADTGGCLLVMGAPGTGKSTVLWELHRTHKPLSASMRLAALLDVVSAKTCRESMLAFCRGPVSRQHGAAATDYDRQIIIDDVDTLPKPVQQILSALIDQFRCTAATDEVSGGKDRHKNSFGRCRFVFSCTALSKIQTTMQARLPCVCLIPPSPAMLAQKAAEEADRRGLTFTPELWKTFCAQYCVDRVNTRSAVTALQRLSLLAGPAPERVAPEWLRDARLEAYDALVRDASRQSVVAAYRELREDHGLAPADLLDAVYVHVRDHAVTEWLSPMRKFQWFELLGRAMRCLPPALGVKEEDNEESDVPWFSVLVASEKSLL